MSNTTYVPLENSLLIRLVNRYGENYQNTINHVIEDFLDRTEEDFDALAPFRETGYMWDQVNLPDGTELRTRYKNEWLVANLKNGKFYFKDKVFSSPAKLCNGMRLKEENGVLKETSNNAWITLEIKRPQDLEFKKADKFRNF